jgi:hypothetical protein
MTTCHDYSIGSYFQLFTRSVCTKQMLHDVKRKVICLVIPIVANIISLISATVVYFVYLFKDGFIESIKIYPISFVFFTGLCSLSIICFICFGFQVIINVYMYYRSRDPYKDDVVHINVR